MPLHVGNVVLQDEEEATRRTLEERLGSSVQAMRLVKKSLDARHKKQVWRGVFRVEVEDETAVLERNPPSVRRWTGRDEGRYGLADGAPVVKTTWTRRPIVVGAGPAGLFAALYLAEAGASVVLIDRGGPVGDRVPAVNGFWRGRKPLDPENNLLFGEGGAGTFSDGKIYTRRRDGELGFIFRRLVDFGADPEVMTEAWAHLGTDKVRKILPVFRERLVELGVDVRYHTAVDKVLVEGERAVGVLLGNGTELRGAPVIVAPGHSARDTLRMLVDIGAKATPRPIAIGARVEHPQTLIDRARYGRDRGELPAASYRLAHNPDNGRRAYTFCMCPGGMIVPASNDPDHVVVNGMSFAARRAMWANSAVITAVEVSDYDEQGPLAGFTYQDRIERAAFELGGGDYRAPAQRVEDFLADRPSEGIEQTSFPMGISPGRLDTLLPPPVVDGMKRALQAFDAELPGFAGPEGVLIAPETRTTSPIRFERDEDGCSNIEDLYPAGEGAGYGGGIISSALDGLRVARAIALAEGASAS